MKKKILFGVIALVTILAFTGCDKILEFMFPDSTGGGNWGDNSIQVVVTVADQSLDWWNYQITVELSVIDPEGNAVLVTEPYRSGFATVPFEDPDATPTASFRFDGVQDGTYRARAWMDINGNWGPDTEDPQTSLHNQNWQTDFAVPYIDPLNPETEQTEVWVYGDLQVPIDVGGGTPFLFVRDGLVQDVNNYWWYFTVNTTVQDTYFDEIHWDIYDPYGYWINGGMSSGNYIEAEMGYWSEGTYTLSIWSASGGGDEITPWQWNVQFQVVDGSSVSGYYLGADVVSYSLSSAPWYFGGEANVVAEFYDADGYYISSYYPGYYGGGWFELWHPYDTPLMYMPYGGSQAGRVRILVDLDEDGNYYEGTDLAAEVQLWASAYYTWWDGSAYRPYFNIDAYRFIPQSDFQRIYGY
jgi:hypothetical protein